MPLIRFKRPNIFPPVIDYYTQREKWRKIDRFQDLHAMENLAKTCSIYPRVLTLILLQLFDSRKNKLSDKIFLQPNIIDKSFRRMNEKLGPGKV